MSSYNGLVNLKMKWGLLRDKDFEHQTKILKPRFRMECSGDSQQGFIDSEEKKRDLWKLIGFFPWILVIFLLIKNHQASYISCFRFFFSIMFYNIDLI